MRYAEIENGKVRFILPAELATDYTILPPNSVEIALDADVQEGDILEFDGTFRRPTENEVTAPYKIIFNAERDKLFSETEWARERHSDRIELDIDDAENWDQWLNYWQSLRDLPNTENFSYINYTFPDKPE